MRSAQPYLSRKRLLSLAALAVLPLAGCHSRAATGTPPDRFEITVRNEGPEIRQLEIDYPSASFGRDKLESGQVYTYQPKIIGEGPIKVAFTDIAGKPHTASGPVVKEGLKKNLVISIGEYSNVRFQDLPNATR